ncbi:MAG: hypothetical protein COX43_01810 [Parcubacteria group bacterium CG23_combo_of_CG06-09_8_20_14_all_35_9]|nr:MAG: hypothetical protein COX43_01810 [Parcubacteria group bacterium CG23_combo_of_CG06-09_8_20_14_all_35_9]
MPKLDLKDLSPKEQKKLLDRFFLSIASLETLEDVKNFFKDLFNTQEIVMFARRIQIAELLSDDYTYDEIAAKLKVGKDTISNVQRWLNYGRGGYKKAIKNVENLDEIKRKKKLRKIKAKDPFSLEWVKQKYPLHFALINDELWGEIVQEMKKFFRKRRKRKSLEQSNE